MMIVALAVLASASFNVATAAKKVKKSKAKTEAAAVVAPVKLANASDTLSYVAGMSFTNGLIPYLLQQGVDSARMDDFFRGFNEIINNANDPKVKAYAIGMNIATQLKDRMVASMKQQFTDTPDSIVERTLYRGFTDAVKNDTTVYKLKNAEEKFRALSESNKKAREEKLYGPNRRAGEEFLAQNAKKDSVVTLPSGLQYKVLVKGNGETPKKTDEVEVNYEGRLIDGTVFDASAKHGSKPATFRPDQVIKGWTEALTMMPVGSKWQLYIPYQLAYGERNAGPEIKPFSALVFDVELVGIKKAADSNEAAKAANAKNVKAGKTARTAKTAKGRKARK